MKATLTELYRGCMRGRNDVCDPVLSWPACPRRKPVLGV